MADNNRGDQESGLNQEFTDPGGHVIWTAEESIEPGSVTQLAAGFVPDVIRWSLEHKGVNITAGQVVVGDKAINSWEDLPFNNRLDLPNAYFGYAGWKP